MMHQARIANGNGQEEKDSGTEPAQGRWQPDESKQGHLLQAAGAAKSQLQWGETIKQGRAAGETGEVSK